MEKKMTTSQFHSSPSLYQSKKTPYPLSPSTNFIGYQREQPLSAASLEDPAPVYSSLNLGVDASPSFTRGTRLRTRHNASQEFQAAALSAPWPEPFHNLDVDTRGKEVSEEHNPVSMINEKNLTTRDLSWRRLYMSRAKLKSTSNTSELLAGFAMVAMVELQINDPTDVPEWLFVVFSVCSTVLVSVHVFALMISTYLLPSIDAISKLHVRGLVSESPHERMWNYIEMAWSASTVLGLVLFLVEIVIIAWVKFWDFSFVAAWASTVVVVPVLVMIVIFFMYFRGLVVDAKLDATNTELKLLEEMKKRLELANDGSSSA